MSRAIYFHHKNRRLYEFIAKGGMKNSSFDFRSQIFRVIRLEFVLFIEIVEFRNFDENCRVLEGTI